MKDKKFNKLREEELIQGLRYSAVNSVRHYTSAIELSKIQMYGIANSHLILAAEESIKALLFFSKLLHPKEYLEVEDIYRDHSKKHQVARDIYISLKHLLDSIRDSIATVIQNIDKFKNQTEETIIKTSTQIVHENVKDRMRKESKEEIKRDKKWWNKANKKKNLGFYVDNEAGEWLLPGDIKESEFNESRIYVEKLIFTPMLVGQMSNSDLMKLVKYTREGVKSESEQKLISSPNKRSKKS